MAIFLGNPHFGKVMINHGKNMKQSVGRRAVQWETHLQIGDVWSPEEYCGKLSYDLEWLEGNLWFGMASVELIGGVQFQFPIIDPQKIERKRKVFIRISYRQSHCDDRIYTQIWDTIYTQIWDTNQSRQQYAVILLVSSLKKSTLHRHWLVRDPLRGFSLKILISFLSRKIGKSQKNHRKNQ